MACSRSLTTRLPTPPAGSIAPDSSSLRGLGLFSRFGHRTAAKGSRSGGKHLQGQAVGWYLGCPAGVQIVGWDPAAKQIRSWVFDSDGGFGEGKWTKKDQRWYIQATGTLPDGSKTSAVNIITYVDENTFTWQSVNREAGGEILPNVDEVVVGRVQEE